MKLIFDIGCNQGQNLDYFLKKGDVVVGIEADPQLVKKINNNFKKYILEKKLFLENFAISEKKGKINFFINKEKNFLSQSQKPNNLKNYKTIKVSTNRVTNIIKKYLKKFQMKKVEFIKIDVESSSELVLRDLIKNKIFSKYLNIEAQSPSILELLLKTPYQSFKFINGHDVGINLKTIKIINKNHKKILHTFKTHSSGPYGEDVPGNYYSKESLLNYFLNNGFGWKDVSCKKEKSSKFSEIEYNNNIHLQGFKYHLKKLFPEFVKSLKNKIK